MPKKITFIENSISPFDSKKAQLLQDADKIAKKQNPNLLGVTAAKERKYSNGEE